MSAVDALTIHATSSISTLASALSALGPTSVNPRSESKL